jgi:hypothetical protein
LLALHLYKTSKHPKGHKTLSFSLTSQTRY